MKVVLDTNVVVSAAFFGGPPRRVVDAWINGQLQLVISPLIFDEHLRVCQRLSAAYPGTDYQPLLTAFLAHSLLVADSSAERPRRPLCRGTVISWTSTFGRLPAFSLPPNS